ncbi:hypothetical protein V6N13_053145 [Hibiscus sabdariffa]|uniref:Uncharacterized protein n=1 Tax=Hibiscus sabdariffa TaxID=183260 RepID=A0ABR2Q6T9_9ROSI
MGKIPPSIRPAISNSLTRRLPLEAPTPIPNHFPEKTTKKKPPQHSRKPQASLGSGKAETFFKSPDLSSAKKVFNYIVATTKSSIDLRFHNTLLQSYSMTPSPFFTIWSKPNLPSLPTDQLTTSCSPNLAKHPIPPSPLLTKSSI